MKKVYETDESAAVLISNVVEIVAVATPQTYATNKEFAVEKVQVRAR
jgi:hypothetical protein